MEVGSAGSHPQVSTSPIVWATIFFTHLLYVFGLATGESHACIREEAIFGLERSGQVEQPLAQKQSTSLAHQMSEVGPLVTQSPELPLYVYSHTTKRLHASWFHKNRT